MKSIAHRGTRPQTENDSSVAAFLAGLPEFRRGKIVTASSDIDSWKRKPLHVERRLVVERAWQ